MKGCGAGGHVVAKPLLLEATRYETCASVVGRRLGLPVEALPEENLNSSRPIFNDRWQRAPP